MTFGSSPIEKFVPTMITQSLDRFRVFAFTHKYLPLELVGKLHIDPKTIEKRLRTLKTKLHLNELMYLSTCNRVEFALVETTGFPISTLSIIEALEIELKTEQTNLICEKVEMYQAGEAVQHLFKVSSSLDSMVIGEREIITQVRKSYEDCHKLGLTGDLMRLVVRKTIETAKKIFTETVIFKKPVSVVSIGFRRLRDFDMPLNSRIVMIGAGKTNRAMIRFLAKHGYKNIHIYNRTLNKAETLAIEVGGKASQLSDLTNHSTGFDILITCTASGEPVLTQERFDALARNEKTRKVIIDLAVPGDVADTVLADVGTTLKYINIDELKVIADSNLAKRSNDIEKCEAIVEAKLLEFFELYKQREIELAMSSIPEKVKEIRNRADMVYAKELSSLNPESREILDRVMTYMEKKYISMPMKMAKEVMLNQSK